MNRQPRPDRRIRPAAVAGKFYPGSPAELDATVRGLLEPVEGEHGAGVAAIMVPHAGYVYSGRTAGRVFGTIELPEIAVILCPNHTGRGPQISVASADAFAIPGADIEVEGELADAIAAAVPQARREMAAHELEHAIEVELPFLHALRPDVRIVPIVLGHLGEDEAIAFGEILAGLVDSNRTIVIASSDMSHYLPDRACREQDSLALAPLLEGDPQRLYRTVDEQRISMCGFIPATAMLSYARFIGAGAPILVDYSTSGDAFGDRSRVVGYAGVLIPPGSKN